MQQAIKAAQEYKQQINESNSSEWDRHMEKLKPEINNLLHTFLPKHITIEQTEILALVIDDMIWNPEKYLTPTQ